MLPALKQPDCFGVWRLSPTDRLARGAIISGSTAPVVCLLGRLEFFFPPLAPNIWGTEPIRPESTPSFLSLCSIGAGLWFKCETHSRKQDLLLKDHFYCLINQLLLFQLTLFSECHVFFFSLFLWRGNYHMWEVSIMILMLITTVTWWVNILWLDGIYIYSHQKCTSAYCWNVSVEI